MKQTGVIATSRALRSTSSRSFIAILCAFAIAVAYSTLGCKRADRAPQHGSSQSATQQDKKQQNRNLVEQVVKAVENQDQYSDQTFLRGALSRLNPWLADTPVSEDFEPDEEYAQLAQKLSELSASAKRAHELTSIFADEGKTPTESECDELDAALLKTREQIDPLAKMLKSNALEAFKLFVDDVLAKLKEARGFQFADTAELYRNQIVQFASSPVYQYYNFGVLSDGLNEFVRLLKTDGKIYLPQDADFLRSTIWMRDVFMWAKGSKQDDLEIVKKLFDWSVKNVVFANRSSGPAGPIATLEWQTLLVGKGTPMDRAIVFMELLRQHRLDSFVLRPENVDDRKDPFPLIVGVRLNNEVYLFSPEMGLPFISSEPDAAVLDPEQGLVVNKVATLRQVAEDDSILRRFDLTDEPYGAVSTDFAKTIAYVPSSPFVVAARMIPLEQEFSGAANTTLSTPFESQKERILESEFIVGVKRLYEETAPILEQIFFPVESELITQIYMTPMESAGNLEISATSDEKTNQIDQEEKKANYGDVKDFSGEASGAKKSALAPLWVGKVKYFEGRFFDENGAARRLTQGRVSDRALRQQEANVPMFVNQILQNYQESKAAAGETATAEEMRAIAQEAQISSLMKIKIQRYVKVATSYALAVLADADHNDDAAMERLNDDSLRFVRRSDAQPNFADEFSGDEFRSAANYLRARILEKKSPATAVARLREQPDRGARVRANLLAQLAGLDDSDDAHAQNSDADEAPTTESTDDSHTEENEGAQENANVDSDAAGTTPSDADPVQPE